MARSAGRGAHAGSRRRATEHGSNQEELEAMVTLLAVYAGFPKASAGTVVVREELAHVEAV